MIIKNLYRDCIKRILDIMCSILAMIVFCWLYVIIAILIYIKLGSPIIFRQKRPGMIDKRTGKEKLFDLYKFRSMTDEKDTEGNLLPDDMRLTKFGKFLRATSLDELPEAWNILKGDMSVIGPRPLLVKYLDRYTEEQRHRHDVRPGLSGWAQVNGRNTISWEDKFLYDIWYTKNISFLLDIKIVFMTVMLVLKRKGINSYTSSTMEEFMGTFEDENYSNENDINN